MPELYQELLKLAESDMYPFHMPGHKRNLTSTPMKGAFRCDITEIDGFDNLHDESGIILEAENRANRLYGADETFFLVNGSTSGVLSAVSAAVKENGTILAARGSHKSFYHAAYLRHLTVKFLPYRLNKELLIPEAYSAKDISDNLTDDIEAVFITSPTYEGKCSDIREIAKVCHERRIPLIVDAAHGAHFGMGDNEVLPESAVSQGADIVIHSVHKTLPSMTQTALIHINGNIVDRGRLKRFLRIYQSSSPSYVLMSSIDLCIKEMEDRGKDFADTLVGYRNEINGRTKNCRNLFVPDYQIIQDPAKVLICVKSGAMTGQQLYDILREEYHLQLEMAGEKSALAIISGWDSQAGIERLIKAILEIDKKVDFDPENTEKRCPDVSQYTENTEDDIFNYPLPEAKLSIGEAWDSSHECVDLENAIGRIAGEFVNLYPPGIPILVPGEVITGQICNEIANSLEHGLNVQGLNTRREIICVRQK